MRKCTNWFFSGVPEREFSLSTNNLNGLENAIKIYQILVIAMEGRKQVLIRKCNQNLSNSGVVIAMEHCKQVMLKEI